MHVYSVLSLYLSLLSLYLFLLFQLLLFLTFDFFCCCSHVMGILFGLPCPFSAIDKMEWRREREKSASHRSTNIPFIDCQIFCHWMRIVETLKRFPIDAHELITFTRNFYAQTDFKSKHTHTHSHEMCSEKKRFVCSQNLEFSILGSCGFPTILASDSITRTRLISARSQFECVPIEWLQFVQSISICWDASIEIGIETPGNSNDLQHDFNIIL